MGLAGVVELCLARHLRQACKATAPAAAGAPAAAAAKTSASPKKDVTAAGRAKAAGKKTKASVKKASSKEQEEAETDVKVISVRIPIEEVAGEEADTEEVSNSGQVVEQLEESSTANLEQFISQKLQPSPAMSKVSILFLSSMF